MKFTVTVHETIVSDYEVEAQNAIDAVDRWQEGQSVRISTERGEPLRVTAEAV